MALKIKYFLFIGIIHGLLAYLLYKLLGAEEKYWFLLIEIGLCGSLLLSFLLYQQFIRPIELLSSGVAAIEDQDFQVKFLQTGAKEVDQLIRVYNRMIDNIRAERVHTQEQHYFMHQLLQTSPSAVIVLDFDDKITLANPRAIELFKIDQPEGKPIREIIHPLTAVIINMVGDGSETIQLGGVNQYKIEGRHFIDSGFKRKFYVIDDLSKEMLANEKRAYGQVIRMMAHEVNNSIGAINSIIETTIDYQSELSDDFAPTIVHSLQIAKERNDMLNAFMRNFSDIVRLPLPRKEPIDLFAFLTSARDLMQATARQYQIDIRLQLNPTHQKFPSMDRQQMELVLVNILKNAIEAIGEQGVIQIRTRPNGFVVQDNGTGIAPENIEKLFTPFYSNKMNGQGIGLTLSREILINHGFEFSLQSTDGWTNFEILFSV